jgi:toxin FitB
MGYLIDTNVLSEMRKSTRGDPGVIAWSLHVPLREMFLSVLVLGEVRRGVEALRGRDPNQANALEAWLLRTNETFAATILPVSREIADCWGRLSVPDRLPEIDGFLAATAIVHGLVLVTRNTRDFTRTGVALFNPFAELPAKP